MPMAMPNAAKVPMMIPAIAPPLKRDRVSKQDGENKKETPSLSGKNNSPTEEEVEEEVEDDEDDDDDDEEVVVDDSVVVREIELEVVLLVVCSLCVKIICVD
ncbi:hypothetical protein MaudCBS49596_005239 [Microsporum audouinii]